MTITTVLQKTDFNNVPYAVSFVFTQR